MIFKIQLDPKQWYQDSSYHINQDWQRFLIQKFTNLQVYTVRISDLAVKKVLLLFLKQITNSQKNSMLNFFLQTGTISNLFSRKSFWVFPLADWIQLSAFLHREGPQNFPCNVGTCDLLFYLLANCNPVLCSLHPLPVQFVK